MFRFIGRRLLVAIPTLFLVVTVAFFMMRAAPGSPFDMDRKLSPEIERNVMAKYGMDKPLHEQYFNYLRDVARGDFGPSLKYKDKSVLQILQENYKVSLVLGLSAIILASVVGVTLGVLAALRQNKLIDYGVMAVAIIGVCIPTFVTAPLLVLIFGSKLQLLPSGGWNGGALANLILPVAVLALPRSNFIRTARAKGISERRILLRHAAPAAILPVVSYLGPAIVGVITGSVVIETVFTLPGVGASFIEGAMTRDYTRVMGAVILYGGLIIVLNLIADIIYALLDPRVRYQ